MGDAVVAMPLDSLFTNPHPAVSRPQAILSRLSSPLSKHAGKMFEVSIEPDDVFKVYSPGEAVKGYIVLTVLKAFDITHLVVALHGYAKVYKHQIAPGEKAPVQEGVINGKGSKGFEYHGNGLASLFQEEQILCGDGFLKKQVYKFAFQVHFPAKSLPSTIEFERGTVSYMISATLTRPVTLNPTHTRHKRIKFQDNVDVESMNTPKSRVISLEPLNRRGKVKKIRPTGSVGTQEASSGGHLSRKNTQTSVVTSATIPVGNPPLSPAPSDDTIATSTTASSTSFQQVEHDTPPTRKPSPQTSDTRSTTTSSSAHTITATTELPRHGALPGDSIPVRVSVAHTKPYVKGVVITTLYRIGRVDMHPAIPLATKGKGKQPEYEDVYIKSRTGLSGLHFASSSPSSVFRKDLSQSSTMMVVNPATLTAEIATSVKVPDAAFPTITNVPGGMISFTYHIEVVIDLFGKLGETRYLPRLTSSDPLFTNSEAAGNQLTHDWSHNILDTAQLRRTKSVVTFEMSVTIGTKDSSRMKKRNRPEDRQTSETVQPHYDQDWMGGEWNYNSSDDWRYDEHGNPRLYDPQYFNGWEGYHEGGEGYHEGGQGYHEGGEGYHEGGEGYYEGEGGYYGGEGGYHEWHDQHPHYSPPRAALIPPPPPQPEEEVDEKTRLRRQEELLMPSQPPQEAEAASRAAALAPSAPVLDGPERFPEMLPDGIPMPSTPGPPASIISARSADTVRPYSTSPPPGSSLSEPALTEDKQELERRRLIEQASAPPADEAGASSSSTSAPPPFFAPTAPAIPNGDTNEAHATSAEERRGSILPQYQL